MKKFAVHFIIFILAFLAFPQRTYASVGLIPPTSKLYFLQTFGESVKLYFTREPQQKFDYLLTLAQRRVDETRIDANSQALSRYQNQMGQAASLVGNLPDKQTAVQKITDASLRQQATLAQVYTRAPNEAKRAILGAQTESSKHVANTIQAVEGARVAEDYNKKVQMILKAEQVEQVPMEGAPSGNPSDQNINPIKSGQGLNPLNTINDQNGGGGMQPAAPIQQR